MPHYMTSHTIQPQILYDYIELLPAHLMYYAVSPANTSSYWDSNNNRHRYISCYYMWSRMCWKWSSTCSHEIHECTQSLTPCCKAWYKAWTLNSSYTARLSVLYGHECISGYFKFKTPHSWAVVVVQTESYWRIKIMSNWNN